MRLELVATCCPLSCRRRLGGGVIGNHHVLLHQVEREHLSPLLDDLACGGHLRLGVAALLALQQWRRCDDCRHPEAAVYTLLVVGELQIVRAAGVSIAVGAPSINRDVLVLEEGGALLLGERNQVVALGVAQETLALEDSGTA